MNRRAFLGLLPAAAAFGPVCTPAPAAQVAPVPGRLVKLGDPALVGDCVSIVCKDNGSHGLTVRAPDGTTLIDRPVVHHGAFTFASHWDAEKKELRWVYAGCGPIGFGEVIEVIS